MFGTQPASRYEGAFFRHESEVYKVIEQIEFFGTIVEFANEWHGAVRRRDSGLAEQVCMPDCYDALIVRLNSRSEALLTLDCKKLFDNRQWGREYTFEVKHKCLVISFEKKNDARENSDQGEYAVHIAIFGEGLEYLPKIKEALPSAKVMMVTGMEDEKTVEAARKLGADDYITKPLVLEYLENNVLKKIGELTGR